MAAITHSKLTELLDKFGGLLKRCNEITSGHQSKSSETLKGTERLMEEHNVTFQVQFYEYRRFKSQEGQYVFYTCELLDGPYKGKIMYTIRTEGNKFAEYPAKYAGKVIRKEHPWARVPYNELVVRKDI
jgi:hypothetical protein